MNDKTFAAILMALVEQLIAFVKETDAKVGEPLPNSYPVQEGENVVGTADEETRKVIIARARYAVKLDELREKYFGGEKTPEVIAEAVETETLVGILGVVLWYHLREVTGNHAVLNIGYREGGEITSNETQVDPLDKLLNDLRVRVEEGTVS